MTRATQAKPSRETNWFEKSLEVRDMESRNVAIHGRETTFSLSYRKFPKTAGSRNRDCIVPPNSHNKHFKVLSHIERSHLWQCVNLLSDQKKT